jgi:PAS domain-containing protein
MSDQDIFSTFIPTGNEMGDLIRSLDWSKTAVGPVNTWPPALKVSISNMLTCRFPMYIVWGEEFTQFYNDAYKPILGPFRHPHAMGNSAKETWSEVWSTIGPMFNQVKDTGEATGFDDFRFDVTRKGFLEESYFTFSYSPIRDESGNIPGVLNTVFETTDRVISDRVAKELRAKEAVSIRALEESEANLKTSKIETELALQDFHDFIMQTPYPMVVLLGPLHRFSIVNPAYEVMVSRKVLGKTVLEAFNLGEVGDFVQLLDKVYLTGITYNGKELPLSIPDTKGVIQQHYLNISYLPFRDRNNLIKGVLAVHHDVTEQVLARKSLE